MRAATRRRERILLMGPWGAGKSYAWVTVARWLHSRKTGAKVYLVDTDHAADAQSSAFEGFDDVVVSKDGNNYNEIVAALDIFHSTATTEDWLVVDLADVPWSAVQNHYIKEAFGKNAASFFVEAKKAGNDGSPLADGYGSNWQVIKKLYDDYMGKVFSWPGHILFCTKAEPVKELDARGKGIQDSQAIRDTFGRFGLKPAGQKNLGFQFLTVLLMQPKGADKWVMTTIKDLHRERLTNFEISDFAMQYLVKVAKWKLA